jgi:hypothetical protein
MGYDYILPTGFPVARSVRPVSPPVVPANPEPMVTQEHLLNYSTVDKGFYRLRQLFVTLPLTVMKGLKGTSDFTFSDTMLVSKVPYYLGGIFLALSPFVGKDYREGTRQGAAVISYLLGTILTHTLVNRLYQWRYGVDLTMLYRTKDGNVDQVFASHDFARFDLLKPYHYAVMGRKMGIPSNIDDPQGAVRDYIRHIIASSRALKLIVGNILSAIGAGFIARSDVWLKVPAIGKAIAGVWRSSRLGLFQKLCQSTRPLADLTASLLYDRYNVAKSSLSHSLVVLGGMATIVATVLYSLSSLGKMKKTYQPVLKPGGPN